MPKKRKPEREAPTIKDPLAVIPCRAPGVEIREAPNGEVHLRKSYLPQGKLRQFLHKNIGWRKERFHNLDDRGTFFWNQIDGERTVAEIIDLLVKEWSITREAALEASIVYIQALMIRNLVVLEIPKKEAGGSNT
ncbi:MAG: PqqD family protein [Candidatus Sumerlaeia bacterium]|nr:PqqD family protein [Candidatus Sumerlaeia bacterium]